MAQYLHNSAIETMNPGECPEDFSCRNCGCSNHIKTRFIASGLIICMDDNVWKCPYSLHYGYNYFCQCPLLNLLSDDIHEERNASESADRLIQESFNN